MNSLLRFFDRNFIVKFFLLLLLYSLFLLADGYLLLLAAPYFGNYAILAVTASTGLAGLIVAVNGVHRQISLARRKIKDGMYPEGEFQSIAGLLLAGILLIIPGFFTDILGLLLFLPVFRKALGRIITSRMDTRLKQAYEYMKIEEY